MSAYSDWKAGALSDEEYRSLSRWEHAGDNDYPEDYDDYDDDEDFEDEE